MVYLYEDKVIGALHTSTRKLGFLGRFFEKKKLIGEFASHLEAHNKATEIKFSRPIYVYYDIVEDRALCSSYEEEKKDSVCRLEIYPWLYDTLDQAQHTAASIAKRISGMRKGVYSC